MLFRSPDVHWSCGCYLLASTRSASVRCIASLYIHHIGFSSIFCFCFCSSAYNPTKADVWSLGATVWEMAESTPPFHDAGDLRDRWPPLTRAKEFSRSLHDFLTLCSNPVASRPDVSLLAQVGLFFPSPSSFRGWWMNGLD